MDDSWMKKLVNDGIRDGQRSLSADRLLDIMKTGGESGISKLQVECALELFSNSSSEDKESLNKSIRSFHATKDQKSKMMWAHYITAKIKEILK